jgi:rare lipoprotein A
MKINLTINESEKGYHPRRVDANTRKGLKESFSEVLKADIASKSTDLKSGESPPIEYVVKPGDTLWKIGKELFKKDPNQIARDNGLSNPDLIHPGQKLLIYPSPSETVQSPVNKEVTASWYGPEHQHKTTASGQQFDMHKDTLAHKTLPFGTKVRLVNPENGKTAEGVVNDRGPYIKGREVDVSYALAKKLGFVKKGVTKLDIEIL